MAKDTGLIKVKSLMDREGSFVKDNKYTALIGASDNGKCEARLVQAVLHGFRGKI